MRFARWSRRTTWALGGGVLVLIAIIVVVTAPWQENGIEYRTTAIRFGDVTQTVSANGTLNPVTVVNVGTQVSGTVSKLDVDFNSRVKAGQVLLTLDPTLFKAQVLQSRAAVGTAEANLKLAEANARRDRLLFKQHYVSQAALDQTTASLQVAEAQLKQARAQLAHDEANLAYTVIRSPINGIIINRMVDVGQTVAASFQTPTLFQIGQNLKRMQIDATVDEADIALIQQGEKVLFTVDAYPNRQFVGKVTQVRLNPTIVQNVVTYDVVVGVDNADEKLLPGMTAYVNVVVSEHRHVLVVPNAALKVSLRKGRSAVPLAAKNTGFIYVITPTGPKRVQVRVGLSDNSVTEVSGSDIKAGEQVVVGEGNSRETSPRSHSMFRLFR